MNPETQLLELQEQMTGVQFTPFAPKIFYNTFPKSGTHLANLLCAHLAYQQTPSHWLGSFRGNSWTTEWVPSDRILPIIQGQPDCTWYQGHVGYKPEFAEAFDEMGVALIFVYRDLRDVAVSQTYHIERADGKTAFHPEKEIYMDLCCHEKRLTAVIEGIGDYPGVLDRWEYYAPWLDEKWILPIKFEDMIHKPVATAHRVVEYVLRRTFPDEPALLTLSDLKAAVAQSLSQIKNSKGKSASYRKGVTGEWRYEFSDAQIQLWKDLDQNHWLERLGYENNSDWQR